MKPRNGPIGKPDRVIVSAKEAEREQVAQKLLAKGDAAFGPKVFNLEKDMAMQSKAGIVLSADQEESARRNMALEAVATAGFGSALEPAVPQFGEQKMEANKQPNRTEESTSKDKVFTMDSKPEVKDPEVKDPEVQDPEVQEQFQLPEDPIERLYKISEILGKTHPNFPTGQQLVNLKNNLGDVFILDLDYKVFIYRYLKRQEWVQMNANEAFHNMRIDQKEDQTFTKCVLWPNLNTEEIAALPAGCVTSVVNQIERKSLFIDPRELANLTIKL